MENIYKIRRDKLGETLRNGEMCLIFSGKEIRCSSDQSYNFEVNKNFFYLTGIKNEDLILFMKKDDGYVKTTLFLENRDPNKIKWVGRTILKDDAKLISECDEIKYLDEFDGFLNSIMIGEENPIIYMDFDRDKYVYSSLFIENYATELKKKYPSMLIKNIFPTFVKLRKIKGDHEISKIKEAIELTKLGLINIMKNLKPNIYEYQIESFFDFSIKHGGATGHAFRTIVASGENATILHYIENDNKIQDGDLVLFDLGAEKDCYKSDISRTFPSNGKFTERQKQIYNIVLDAQIKVIESIRPGVTQAELQEIAKENLFLGLKNIGKLNEREELSKYYYHGIGHGLGLDTHDIGGRELVYEEGMVITVEPGLYIQDEKIGIRIEDDVLVTKNGYEVLSKDIIKTVEDIESFMENNNG